MVHMPSDQTRNNSWCIAHQMTLLVQPTDRRKCGKRITVDHVYFGCRFAKPLWQVFDQSIGLGMKALIPQIQQPFMAATLFHSRFRKKEDMWCDMAHSDVYHQAWVRWLLCNDIIPKAIPLSQPLLHNSLSWQNIPTPNDLLTLQQHTWFDTHMTAPHTHEGRVHVADIDCC